MLYSITNQLKSLHDERRFPIGQVVSYGDRANPRRNAVVIGESLGKFQNGQECIFLDDGKKGHVSPKVVEDPGGWEKVDYVMSDEELARALRNAERNKREIEKQKEIEKAQEESRREQEHASLLEKYPHLTQQEQTSKSSHTLAAANIRKELKRAFPGVKFSVRSECFTGGSSVDIRYTDGPDRESVEEITNKYQEGHFDGMYDIYEYHHKVWTEIFGSAKYVMVERDISEETRRQAARELDMDPDGDLGVDDHRDIRRKANEILERQ